MARITLDLAHAYKPNSSAPPPMPRAAHDDLDAPLALDLWH